MSDDNTIREDSAIYAIISSFPFAEADFIVGFECGMLWRELWTGKEIIEGSISEELQDGVAAMAAKRGYECEFTKSALHRHVDVKLKNVERRDPAVVAEFLISKIEKLSEH